MAFFLRAFTLLAPYGLGFAAALPATAQTAPPAEKVYTYVEQMPQPPGGGGNGAIIALIQQHVTYPRRAELARAEGRVFVSFTVAPTGKVEDVAVAKGFRYDCDSAAVEGVKQLPRFEPGRQVGRAVPVRFTAPVTFRLQAPQAAAVGPGQPKAVYTYIDQPPQLAGKGGVAAISTAVQQQLAYPARALRDGVAGRVFVAVLVATDGSISEAKVVKGVRSDCDSAAVAAVQRLPPLSPPRLNGRAVYYSFTLPVVLQAPAITGKP